jgi:O-6-methylguanine DNA methyltransferase
MVYYSDFRISQLKRTFLIAKNEKGVCNISFNNNKKQFVKMLSEHSGDKVIKNKLRLKDEVKQILEYYAGKRKTFNMKVLLTGTKFQTKVWLALAKVKFGETVSYSELAKMAGNKNAFRAAATCCATNPVAIIIPCHRVIAKSGAIGGFGGGIPMKKFMLKLEGVM